MKLILMIATILVFACVAQAEAPSTNPAASQASSCHMTYVACTSVDCLVIDDEIAYDDDDDAG